MCEPIGFYNGYDWLEVKLCQTIVLRSGTSRWPISICFGAGNYVFHKNEIEIACGKRHTLSLASKVRILATIQNN